MSTCAKPPTVSTRIYFYTIKSDLNLFVWSSYGAGMEREASSYLFSYLVGGAHEAFQ
jgi:hypothetical protein